MNERYIVKSGHQNCHPETCCCHDWGVYDTEEGLWEDKDDDKEYIQKLCDDLNAEEKIRKMVYIPSDEEFLSNFISHNLSPERIYFVDNQAVKLYSFNKENIPYKQIELYAKVMVKRFKETKTK